MSKAKNKSVVKKNNNLNKKSINNKKKTILTDEVNNIIKEPELVKMPSKKTASKKKSTVNIVTAEKEILTPEELLARKKERNRKKYENKQKKYQSNKKIQVKKKVIIPDEISKKNKKNVTKEEKPIKKLQEQTNDNKEKKKERKEKRKLNRKSIHLTQTLVSIKEKGVNKINLVKEKTNDKNIPIGKTQEEKKRRFKRIIKESIFYAIVLTIINVICILVFDYFSFLRLFDVKTLNIVVTIVLFLIFNFFVAFMIDYFTTEIWLKTKRKKKVDDLNGNSGFNEGKYQENIENKEGE